MRGGETRSQFTSQCPDMWGPVTQSPLLRSPDLLYIRKQSRLNTSDDETFIQTERRQDKIEYFLRFILDSLLYMYCVLRCWVFIHVLCDLSVVTWGSMSQCHGHCNASCHMSHTGHYTLHYNTASINHYTLGSDRYLTLSPWSQVTRSPGHWQFDQHLRGRGLRHWHCSDNEDKCVSFASMRGRLFFMSIRHVVMTGWRVDGDQCTGVIIL